jgi:hypothetical protein
MDFLDSGDVMDAVRQKLEINNQLHVLEQLPELSADSPIVKQVMTLIVIIKNE